MCYVDVMKEGGSLLFTLIFRYSNFSIIILNVVWSHSLTFDRASDQWIATVGRLGAQHGDLWHHQWDRRRVGMMLFVVLGCFWSVSEAHMQEETTVVLLIPYFLFSLHKSRRSQTCYYTCSLYNIFSFVYNSISNNKWHKLIKSLNLFFNNFKR